MTRAQRKAFRTAKAEGTNADGNQPHPNPDDDGGQHNQRNWNGHAIISGEVTVQPPPDFLAEYKATQHENATHNKKTRLIGWLTLIAVVVYAGLTMLLWSESRKANGIALQSSERGERPYIAMAPSGEQFQLSIAPPGDEHAGEYVMRFRFSNYGRTPAEQQSTEAHVLVGKEAISKIGQHWGEYYNLRTIPPGDKPDVFAYSDERADPKVFDELRSGTALVAVYSVIKYTDIFSGSKPLFETGICFEVGPSHKEVQDACRNHDYVK